MEGKYPIEYKTVEKLVKEANELLAASKDMDIPPERITPEMEEAAAKTFEKAIKLKFF